MNKHMWNWMDKVEGKKEGTSAEALEKEKKRQGYKKEVSAKKEKVAKKMLPKENVQEAVSYKKSRSHRLLKEQAKKIHSKYYN